MTDKTIKMYKIVNNVKIYLYRHKKKGAKEHWDKFKSEKAFVKHFSNKATWIFSQGQKNKTS